MNNKTRHLLWLWLLSILSVALQAQEVVATSGGYEETSGARVTWTLGEIITETMSGTSAILTEGFNQGDLTITMIKGQELKGLIVKAYPNPTAEYLKISIGDADQDNLNYALIDMGGKVIIKSVIKGTEFEIPFMNLTPSTYLLKIYQTSAEIAIFKIIKK